jgi:hypothetical protein
MKAVAILPLSPLPLSTRRVYFTEILIATRTGLANGDNINGHGGKDDQLRPIQKIEEYRYGIQ